MISNDETDQLSLVKVECLPKKLTWKTIVDKAGASVDESSIIKSLVYMHNLRTNLYAVPGYLNRSEKGIYAADATLLPISVCVPSLPFLACRTTYPESVWGKVLSLFPNRSKQRPIAIDIAVGSEGRAGVELAKR